MIWITNPEPGPCRSVERVALIEVHSPRVLSGDEVRAEYARAEGHPKRLQPPSEQIHLTGHIVEPFVTCLTMTLCRCWFVPILCVD